ADIVDARAAVLLRQVRAKQSQVGHFGNQFDWEFPFFKTARDDRFDALPDKGSDRLPRQLLFVRQQGIKLEKIYFRGAHPMLLVGQTVGLTCLVDGLLYSRCALDGAGQIDVCPTSIAYSLS